VTRRALARSVLALAVLGVCVGGFFTCFEKREIEIETGVSSAARRDRYLALGRLLERMGHTVVSLSNPERLAALPPPPATLILPTARHSIGAERSESLLEWVRRGGHLVVVTYSVWTADPGSADDQEQAGEKVGPALSRDATSRPDPILDRFGLRQIAGRSTSEEDEDPAAEDEPSDAPAEPFSLADALAGRFPGSPTESSWAYFSESEAPLEVGFSPDYQWFDPDHVAVWSVTGPAGVHLVELTHGSGRISALTSDEPLSNTAIAMHDNAEFVVRWLRRDAAASGPIWIVYDEDWPSLFARAGRHALPALIAAAVLVFTWVWSVVFRSGPMLPPPAPARRAWLEHLDAVGRFHWRQDHARSLLAGMREDVARRVRERHPGWRQLTNRERAEHIASRAGISADDVELALASPVSGSRAFIAAVSALQRIRTAL
jgi:hypothetical protein